MEGLIKRVFFEMPTPVAVISGTDLSSILANPAFETLVGEQTWIESLDDLRPFLAHVLESGNTCRIENRPIAVSDGGAMRYLSYTFTHMPAMGHEPSAILVTALDTTEQYQARVRMRDLLRVGIGPRKFDLDDSATSIVVLDSTGEVLYMNGAERRSLGLPEDEGSPIDQTKLCESGRPFTFTRLDGTILGEADLPGARALRGRVTVTDIVKTYTDGRERQVLTCTSLPVWGPDGHVAMAIVVSRDISSQYRHARERAAERAKLNAILQQIPVGVIVVDPVTMSVILQNDIANELLGVSECAVMTGLSQALSGQTVVGREVEVNDVQGDRRWLRVSSAPIHDDAGVVIAVVCVFGDLTARRREESERESLVLEHEREMSYLLESKDKFVSLAAHELKTPLTVLMANMQLFTMAWESLSGERRAAMLVSLMGQCRKLSRLVNDLLDIGRLTSGHLTMHKELVDLGVIVRSVVEDQAKASPSHVFVVEGQGLCPMMADSARLEQVLSNLIANAVRYSPPASTVCTGMEVFDGRVVVWVRDEGVGIHPDDIPYVFDMYYRSEAVRADKPAGLGLGLYVAREVALLHGGDISVSSEMGVGSTFTMTLPIE